MEIQKNLSVSLSGRDGSKCCKFSLDQSIDRSISLIHVSVKYLENSITSPGEDPENFQSGRLKRKILKNYIDIHVVLRYKSVHTQIKNSIYLYFFDLNPHTAILIMCYAPCLNRCFSFSFTKIS